MRNWSRLQHLHDRAVLAWGCLRAAGRVPRRPFSWSLGVVAAVGVHASLACLSRVMFGGYDESVAVAGDWAQPDARRPQSRIAGPVKLFLALCIGVYILYLSSIYTYTRSWRSWDVKGRCAGRHRDALPAQ